MRPFSHPPLSASAPSAALPALLLSRYLFFLTHRPISRSNTHYARRRIRGLQSLGALLEEEGDERLAASTRLLRTLDPSNVHEVAERLQLMLVPFARADVPADYVGAASPPPPEFARSARRIVLVLGPAIGIGDEIVTFPLPGWIKAACPEAHVTTLTAYEGLWDDVEAVDRVETYDDHRAVVEAMRGDADLVLLADFENPELYRAVAAEGVAARYVELSLGARVLAAVDNRERWTYEQRLPAASFTNVYDGFDELVRVLGLEPDRPERAPPRDAEDEEEVRIFVSPFSSKYDPSPVYWSALLAMLVPDAARRRVRFVLDPGPSSLTRRLALDVARAAAARDVRRDVAYDVADGDRRAGLSLPGVFAELRRSRVVVCADSFAAHAAARLGCTTLVLASPGVESWRVPTARSYYFDAEAPVAEVVAGMRQVLALHGIDGADVPRPAVGDAEARLAGTEAELARALADDAPLEELCAAYERFRAAREEVAAGIATWPRAAAPLATDFAYGLPARVLNDNGGIPRGLEGDVRRFVANQRLVWRNTNVSKYLAARLGEARP